MNLGIEVVIGMVLVALVVIICAFELGYYVGFKNGIGVARRIYRRE